MLPSRSPRTRVWRRFRGQRLGYWSLVAFVVLFGISLFAEVIASDRPWVVRYEGHWYFPLVKT